MSSGFCYSWKYSVLLSEDISAFLVTKTPYFLHFLVLWDMMKSQDETWEVMRCSSHHPVLCLQIVVQQFWIIYTPKQFFTPFWLTKPSHPQRLCWGDLCVSDSLVRGGKSLICYLPSGVGGVELVSTYIGRAVADPIPAILYGLNFFVFILKEY